METRRVGVAAQASKSDAASTTALSAPAAPRLAALLPIGTRMTLAEPEGLSVGVGVVMRIVPLVESLP